MAKKKMQPWGITLSCILLAVAGLVTLVAGGASIQTASTSAVGTGTATTTITDPTGLMSYMPVPGMLTGISVALVVVGLVFFAFAYLLWQRNEIAWYGATALIGISIGLTIVQALFFGLAWTTPMLVSIGLGAVIILGLTHKDTIKVVNPDINWNGWAIPS